MEWYIMNPLSKFTKIPLVYVKMCSNGHYPYPSDVIENSSGNEIGVCARSARDELMFNNPDALMNGEAVVEVIKNNVIGVQNPNKLFVPDVEQLLIAIKLATKETSYSIESTCPNCQKHGAFERDLQQLLDSATMLDEVPHLLIDGVGLLLKFRPLYWHERSEYSQEMFLCHKQAHMLEQSEGSDEEKIKNFAGIFDKMTEINFNMMSANIMSIETPSVGNEKGEVIDNQEFIKDWLGKQPTFILEKIKNEVDKLNKIGIDHSMGVECSECNHQWELNGLYYDPSDFFVRSFSSQNQKK